MVKAIYVACRLFLYCQAMRGEPMSKGMDRKKEAKKKPAKTFDEKRAAKRERRDARRR
jgi:hypothetical protein